MRCEAHMMFDNDEQSHRCHAEARQGKRTCYLHSKYVAGLCAPDYDYNEAARSRDADASGINRVSVGATTVWERGRVC